MPTANGPRRGALGTVTTALWAATFVAMAVTAVVPAAGAFAVSAALSYVLQQPATAEVARRLGQRGGSQARMVPVLPDALWREITLLREVFAALLIARAGTTGVVLLVLVAGILFLHGARSVALVLRVRAAKPRVLVRNLALPPAGPAPHRLLRAAGPAATITELALVASAIVAALGFDGTLVVVAVLAAAAASTAFVLAARQAARDSLSPRRVRQVEEALRAVGPRVALYHGAPAGSMYQVNMWLGTLEQLEQPAVVILREPSALQALASTSTPAVCLPERADALGLTLPTLGATFYAAAGTTVLHSLRPAVRSIFIGHGDSDKAGSVEPFLRVYDEIWVAGPAAAERLRANVHTAASPVRVVGRPQATAPTPARKRDSVRTVLYAPTWEGQVPREDYSSVVRSGRQIVATLLSLPDVRVLFRPHPSTGQRLPAAREAVAEIRALLDRAEEAQPGTGHRTVTDLGLPECFDAADLLVADVSGVVTDFLGSAKPYVMTVREGTDKESFRRAHRTAGAAYLIDADAAQLPEVVHSALSADPLAADRRELARYLLGDVGADALCRWRLALAEVLAQPAAD